MAALDLALFLRDGTGRFHLTGTPPTWLPTVWPGVASTGVLDPTRESAALKSFLPAAEAFWHTGTPGRIRSPVWTEPGAADANGSGFELAVMAVTWENHSALVVERLPLGTRGEAPLRPANHALALIDQRLQQAENSLRAAKETAEAANAAKSTFLTHVSHEIRTPLNGLLGMLEHVLVSSLTSEQRSHLETAQQSGENLLAIVNGLLDHSKIEAGRLELHEESFRLRDEFDACLQPLQLRARQRGIPLTLHIAPSVPDAVHGDRGRLRQVVLNLVDNALKFTAHGRIEVYVSTTEIVPHPAPAAGAGSVGYDLHVTVSDTGMGIAPEKLPILFQPFAQADAGIQQRFGGTGLGLAICQQLVSLMQGRISARSRPGHGSEFSFTVRLLPTQPSPLLPLPAPIRFPENTPVPPQTARRPLRVLVADDNSVNRDVAAAFLQKLGHPAPVFAENGRDALDMLLRSEFDVVLMDVQMPKMDGLAATQELRRREDAAGSPRLPVIALTSHAGKAERAACIAAGMDIFLTKPVRRAALEKALESLPPPALDKPSTAPSNESFINQELRELLRTTTTDGIARLHEALNQQNARGGINAAHYLRGGLAILEDATLATLAGTIEDALKHSDFTAARQRTQQLVAAVDLYFSLPA